MISSKKLPILLIYFLLLGCIVIYNQNPDKNIFQYHNSIEIKNKVNVFSASSSVWDQFYLVSDGNNAEAFRPSISVANNGDIHIVWEEHDGSSSFVYYKMYNSVMRYWTDSVKISTGNYHNSEGPVVDVDLLGNVHIIWFDSLDILYKFFNTETKQWSSISRLNSQSSDGARWPDIDIDDTGNIYVVWHDKMVFDGSDTDDYDIFIKSKRIDSGLWTPIELVSSESSRNSWWPAIISDNNIAYIIWEDLIPSSENHELKFKYKNFSSSDWSPVHTFAAENPFRYLRPDIELDNDGDIHLVFNANSKSDIFYQSWNSNTNYWSPKQKISADLDSDSYVPRVSADSKGNVHVVWFDDGDLYGSSINTTISEIFYRKRDKATGIWGSITIISDDGNDYGWRTHAAMGPDDKFHVVWSGSIALKSGIFYKVGFDPDSYNELTFVLLPELSLEYEYSTINNNLRWYAVSNNALNPSYVIIQDGIEKVNNSWNSNSPINLNIDGLGIGIYNLTIIISDGNGNNLEDEVIVSVINITPKITHLSNFYYKFGTFGHSLTWIVTDNSIFNPTYTIYKNDTQLVNLTWISGDSIIFNLGGLKIGNFSFKIVIEDGLGERVTDEVLVIVTSQENGIFDLLINLGYGLIISISLVSVSTLILKRNNRK